MGAVRWRHRPRAANPLSAAQRSLQREFAASATFPIRGADGVLGVLVAFQASTDRPTKGLLNAVQAACRQMGLFIDRRRAEVALHASAMELSALASTNSLTGLKNRREFDRALRTIPRQPFAILSLDVDGLKTINDTEGHAAGDAMLRLVGHTLELLVRGWDVMARVGGDEFAALLPEVGVPGAEVVAERMRAAMHALLLPSGPARITVGWSAAPAGADPVSVWQKADKSLYRAKKGGGDRVVGLAYQTGESRRHRRAILHRRHHTRAEWRSAHDDVSADCESHRRNGPGL